MDEWERQEIEDKIAEMDKLQKAAQIKAARVAREQQEQLTARIFDKALKKYNLTPQEWQRRLAEDPDGAVAAYKENVKGYVKAVVKGRGRASQPQPRRGAVEFSRRQPPSRMDRKDIESLKSEVKSGKRVLSDDELAALMPRLL